MNSKSDSAGGQSAPAPCLSKWSLYRDAPGKVKSTFVLINREFYAVPTYIEIHGVLWCGRIFCHRTRKFVVVAVVIVVLNNVD